MSYLLVYYTSFRMLLTTPNANIICNICIFDKYSLISGDVLSLKLVRFHISFVRFEIFHIFSANMSLIDYSRLVIFRIFVNNSVWFGSQINMLWGVLHILCIVHIVHRFFIQLCRFALVSSLVQLVVLCFVLINCCAVIINCCTVRLVCVMFIVFNGILIDSVITDIGDIFNILFVNVRIDCGSFGNSFENIALSLFVYQFPCVFGRVVDLEWWKKQTLK
jgi:hypothetical protein